MTVICSVNCALSYPIPFIADINIEEFLHKSIEVILVDIRIVIITYYLLTIKHPLSIWAILVYLF